MRISLSVRQTFFGIVGKWRQSAFSVTCIALSFLVLGSFLLLVLNLEEIKGKIKGKVQMELYLAEDITSLQLHKLLGTIRDCPEVERMEYRSRRDALVQMESFLGIGSLEGLDPTALPASLLLSLGREHRGFRQVRELAFRLRSQEGVEDVEFGEAWLERADRTAHMFLIAMIIFGAIIVVALVTIVSNLMRVVVRSQATVIRTMDWLGAKADDIGSFLIMQGLLLGGAGALTGTLFLWMVYSVFTSRVSTITFLPIPVILGLIGSGMILGALGALLWNCKRLRPEA